MRKQKRWVALAVAGAAAAMGPGARAQTATVTSGGDVSNPSDGVLTLREAIAAANAGTGASAIGFAPGVATVSLTQGELQVTRGATITGRGQGGVLVERSGAPGTPGFRIFHLNANASVQMSGLTIRNGRALSGGGILNLNTTLFLSNCVVSGNGGAFDGGPYPPGGGGIFTNAPATLSDCTIAENAAPNASPTDPSHGGGILASGASLSLERCAILDNTAGGDGGGVALLNSPGTLANCTIDGNSAGQNGGGVFARGQVDVVFCTITRNSALSRGGGLDALARVLGNAIVAANTAATGPDISGSVQYAARNLVGNGAGATLGFGGGPNFVGTGSAPLDPRLGPLALNGGPTPTRALLPGSPALNRGGDVFTLSPASSLAFRRPTDQRGLPRPRLALPDIGAFEEQREPDTLRDTAIETLRDTPFAFSRAFFESLYGNPAPNTNGVQFLTLTRLPARGTLRLNGGAPLAVGARVNAASLASLRYVPAAGAIGPDSFGYTVTSDVVGYRIEFFTSNEADVNISVLSSNSAPVAQDDTASTSEDVPLTVQVLANDADADADALSVLAVDGAGTRGTLAISADKKSVRFVPEANFSGTTSFGYTVSDGEATDTATVTITVAAANDAPVARADTYTSFGAELSVAPAQGVLANDSDAEGQSLSAVLKSGPTNGTLTLRADGSFTFVPEAGFSGVASFTYAARDGALESAPATASITVSRDTFEPRGQIIGGANQSGTQLRPFGANVFDPTVIRGLAVPSSGMRSVLVQLRAPSGLYWNGTRFQTAAFDLPTVQRPSSVWLLNAPLPPATQTPPGRYQWLATASDNVGNIARAYAFFTLSAPAPTRAAPAPSGEKPSIFGS